MKNHFAAVIVIIFLLGTAQVADAIHYEFSDNSNGQISATMDISISGSSPGAQPDR